MQGECQALDGFLSGGGGEKQAVDRKEHRERLNRNLLSSLSPSVPSSPPSYGPRSHHQVPLSPCSGATAPRPMLPKAPGAARGVAGERVPTSDRPPLAPGLAPDQLLTLGRFLTLLTYVLIGRMSPRQSRPSGPTRCQWSPMRGWAGRVHTGSWSLSPGWATVIQACGPAAATLPGPGLIGGGSRVSQGPPWLKQHPHCAPAEASPWGTHPRLHPLTQWGVPEAWGHVFPAHSPVTGHRRQPTGPTSHSVCERGTPGTVAGPGEGRELTPGFSSWAGT